MRAALRRSRSAPCAHWAHRGRGCSPASRSPACSLTLGFLTVADAGWAHAVGVVTLFAAVVTGFRAAVPVGDPAGAE